MRLLAILLLSGCTVHHLPQDAYIDMQSTLNNEPTLYTVSPDDGTENLLYKLQSCNVDLVEQWNDKHTARSSIDRYSN